MQSKMLDFMSAFSQACDTVTCTDTLADVLKTHFEGLSVKMFSYIHCPPLGAADYAPSEVITYFGYPRRWQHFYMKNRCCDSDPFIGYAFEKNNAFKWDEAIKANDQEPAAEAFISEIKNLGIKEGYAFPVFGARYRSGFFTFGFDENAPSLSPFQLSMLQWACQLAHHRFVELKTKQDSARANLTTREKEILKWVSFGKSNGEISDILDISKHTIDGYLRNIYIKLDVTERVSASHRALALGLL